MINDMIKQTRRKFLKLGAAAMSSVAFFRTGSRQSMAIASQGDKPTIDAPKMLPVTKDRQWPDTTNTRTRKKCRACASYAAPSAASSGTSKTVGLSRLKAIPTIPTVAVGYALADKPGLNHQYHPERLLYPLKRVGARGDGKWKRVTWDGGTRRDCGQAESDSRIGKPRKFCVSPGPPAIERCVDTIPGRLRNSNAALASLACAVVIVGPRI